MYIAVARLMSRRSALLTFVELAARMDITDDALLIDQERHGSEVAVLGKPPSFQCAPISINGNWKFEMLLLGCAPHLFHAPLARWLWVEDAHNLQTASPVRTFEIDQRRRGGFAIWAAFCPPTE